MHRLFGGRITTERSHMDAREAHFRKRPAALRHAIQNFTMIIRQRSAHRPHVIRKSFVPPELRAKGSSKAKLPAEQFRTYRQLAAIPNARIKRLHNPRSTHVRPFGVTENGSTTCSRNARNSRASMEDHRESLDRKHWLCPFSTRPVRAKITQ